MKNGQMVEDELMMRNIEYVDAAKDGRPGDDPFCHQQQCGKMCKIGGHWTIVMIGGKPKKQQCVNPQKYAGPGQDCGPNLESSPCL